MKEFNSTSASEAGFTLIEILIAITLLSFIALGVVSVTENAALTKERTTEMNSNNLQVETALSRFEWDFSQIYSPLYFSTVMSLNPSQGGAQGGGGLDGGFTGDTGGNPGGQISPAMQNYYENLVRRFERNEHFSSVSKEGLPIPRFYSPEKNVFEFFTTSNRRKVQNTRQSHFAWVRYSLAEMKVDTSEEKNPNIPQGLRSLVRYFAPEDPYDDKRIDINDTDRVKGAVLLNNVENLEFQFWDYNRRKWETNLRTIPGGENVIRGVKILLTWYDSSGNKRTITRIFRNHWPMVAPQDPAQNNRPQGGAGGAGGAAGGAGGGQPADEDE